MREDLSGGAGPRRASASRFVPLPVAPALWALRMLERCTSRRSTPWVYETASKDSFVSIEKAENVLG